MVALVASLQKRLVKEQKRRVKAEAKERKLQNKVTKEKEHAAASKNNLILLMESEEQNEVKLEETEAAKAEADARFVALRRAELRKKIELPKTGCGKTTRRTGQLTRNNEDAWRPNTMNTRKTHRLPVAVHARRSQRAG